MADAPEPPKGSSTAPQNTALDSLALMRSKRYPPVGFPSVYADGALNMAPVSGVVRYYLTRLDPPFDGGPDSQYQPVAQVVMPVAGFVQMVVFFEQSLEIFMKQGAISRELVEKIRADQYSEQV